MTSADRADRRLETGIADLAMPHFPDYFDDVVAVTGRTRQRPAWTFPGRWIPMVDLAAQHVRVPRIPWRAVGVLAVALLILAIALAAIVGSQRRVPPPFGVARNGLVAYVTHQELWVTDILAGTSRRIADGGPMKPTFSLDGTRIAFLRPAAVGSDVVVTDPDGSHQLKLTSSPIGSVDALVWSPDGRSIAIDQLADGTRAQRVLIAQSDGTGIKPLAVDMPSSSPAWRPPDGREVAFRGVKDGIAGLFVVPAAGGTVRQLAVTSRENDDIGFPAWSPDGSRLAYTYDASTGEGRSTASLHFVDADGTHDITAPASSPDAQEYTPAWSPDGRFVAVFRWYSDESANGEAWVSILPTDGSTKSVDATNREPITQLGSGGWTTTWAPDGKSVLAFESLSSKLLVIDPVTGHATPTSFTSTSTPTWQRLAP